MGRPTTVKVGVRYGRLVVTDIISNGKGRGVSAVCDCDCGTQGHPVLRENLKKMRSCGCSQHDTAFVKARSRDSYPTKPAGEAQMNSYHRSYLVGAERRGFAFEISKAQFVSLVSQPCFYCGALPKSRNVLRKDGAPMYNGEIFVNGIDRIDNAAGYVIDNCVSCCTSCNMAKHKATSAEFIKRCIAVAKRHGGLL